MVMNQIQDRTDKVFHPHDLVVWHARSQQGSLPIPGVVVRQEEDHVVIRARLEGSVRELDVSPDELVER